MPNSATPFSSPTLQDETANRRVNLQGLLALPWCGVQLLATAAKLLGDDSLQAADPALAVGVTLAYVFGIFALTESMVKNPADETIGRGRLVTAGLVVMFGLDVWSAIRLADLLPHAGPIMAGCKILIPILLGGRMVVTIWNLANRSWNWAMGGVSMAESAERS